MRSASFYGEQRLEATLRPELALHLTQEMRLRLEILQANILSLEEMLHVELEQNPALELTENEPEEREEKQSDEFSVDDFYPSGATSYGELEEGQEPGSLFADRSSIEEHMMRQIACEFSGSDGEYRIARYILDGLDEDGFLHEQLSQIAQDLGVDPETVERVRNRIQSLEPVGLASRDVREALIVQLKVLGYDEKSPEVRILTEFFDFLLQRRITSLAHKLGLGTEEVARAFENISSLDPKPGRNFRETSAGSVQPDMSIKYREGNLEVVINEAPLPPLRLSAKVREILENPTRFRKDELEFAKSKLERAQMFIKGILQRRDTLTRLAGEILHKNYDFFDGRNVSISSLLMKDVAETLGLHASTISRAVRDKYIETPAGIFPLRAFFSKVEKDPVMEKLKEIIDSENKESPLADIEIAEQLKEYGMNLSRRTVAKYRQILNLPDCFQRKALK